MFFIGVICTPAIFFFFFFNDTATTEIYTLSLHDALPIFRLGVARDIPAFGGANLVTQTFLSFPRLFYGDPSTLTILFAQIGLPVPCASSNLTDAQIAAMGLTCAAKSPNGTNKPLYGIDHLNSVVAPGH